MGAPAAIGAGALLGAVQNHQKEVKYNREKELAAQTEQYSPWTHLHADQQALNASRPDLMGSMVQGATTGGMMAQSVGGAAAGGAGGAGAAGAAGASGTPTTNPWTSMYQQNDPNFFSGPNPYSK